MQKVKPPQDKWQNTVFFLIALLAVVVDQLSKMWIRSFLPEGRSWAELGFFRLTHVHNSGGVFGLFQGQSVLLTIAAFIGIAILLVYALFVYRRFPFSDGMLGKSALGLVFGGTIGNLIDRLRLGYVTDFIDFGFWPAFNVADSAVVIGIIIFAYSLGSLVGADRDKG